MYIVKVTLWFPILGKGVNSRKLTSFLGSFAWHILWVRPWRVSNISKQFVVFIVVILIGQNNLLLLLFCYYVLASKRDNLGKKIKYHLKKSTFLKIIPQNEFIWTGFITKSFLILYGRSPKKIQLYLEWVGLTLCIILHCPKIKNLTDYDALL